MKAVLCRRVSKSTATFHHFDILISGSADSTIIIWSVSDGSKLHTLVGHSRGVLCLAIDQFEEEERPEHEDVNGNDPLTLFSGSSDREIRRWKIPTTTTTNIHGSSSSSTSNGPRSTLSSEDPPIVSHETSVYALHFDMDDDLWTASADGTAKCLSRAHGWQADTILQHGDYVRAVAIDETAGLVMTAGRDEDVKIWDKASGRFVFAYRGHYDEITGLVCLKGLGTVVSVGIDGTVRRWSLKGEDIEKAKREREDEERGVEKEETIAGEKEGLVTEDEEKELAELMDEDDDE